jgi:hypothetical protein
MSPLPLLQIQTAQRIWHLSSSGSKKIGMSDESKASPSLHKTRIEVSYSAPYLLHKELSNSPIIFQMLYPGIRPITTPDCVLFNDSGLVLAVGLEPEINFRICLWELIRSNLTVILLIKNLLLMFYSYLVYIREGPSWQNHVTRIQFRVLLYFVLCNVFIYIV